MHDSVLRKRFSLPKSLAKQQLRRKFTYNIKFSFRVCVGIWEMTTWSLTLTLWTHVRTKQTAEYYCHSNYGIYQRTYKWVNRITSVYGSSIPNTREDAINPVQEGQRIQHRCGINKRQITYIDWLDWITSSPGQTEHSSRRFLPDQSKTLFCDDTIKGAEDENINDV